MTKSSFDSQSQFNNSETVDALETPPPDKQREARRSKNMKDWLDGVNQGSIRMSTDEAYRLEISKKLS